MGLANDIIVAALLSAKLANRDTKAAVVAAQDALYDRTSLALTKWAPHLNSRRAFNQLADQCAAFLPEGPRPPSGYVDIGEDLNVEA